MRRIFLMMLVAMIATVSCQKSELTTQNGSGDEVTVNISAVMQSDNATTRAIADKGKATEINRCIMEIYTSDNELYQRQVTSVDASLKASFSINLVPDKAYDFVFWADYSTNSESDYYYTTNGDNGLKAITANYTDYDGNDEKRDAFFATVNQEITASASNVEAKLYRPFGQVNVSTYVTDLIESYLPTTVQVEYTSNNIATTFNAFDGTTSGSDDFAWEAAVDVIDAPAVGDALYHLSTDYIFAPAEGQALIDFMMEFFNNGASIMTNDKFTSIPVQRNYRTNISGNLLTIGSEITVEVVPTFTESDIEVEITTVETVAEVSNALAVVTTGDDANVTVTGTVSGDSDNHIVVPDAVASTTGETSITVTFEDVDAGAEISFGGDTKDDESEYDGTVYITAPAGVEFEDLNINLPNAHIVFNGEAKTVTESASGSTFVVAEGASIGTLNVNAGNVVVYGTVETINYDNTISKVYYGVSTVAELTDVISKYDGAIFKNNISGVDATNLDLVTITKSNFVLDGAGFTLSGQGSKNNVLTIGGEDNHISGVVVKDLTIEQDGATVTNNGMTVYASEASLENVTIQNCGKAALIVNAGEVTATDFYTSGNSWGGVNVSLGSGTDVVGMTPKFYFVSGEISEEAQIWVDDVDSWEVTTPEDQTWYEGWVSETVYMYSQTEFTVVFDMKGKGTQESPYLITSALHLENLAANVNIGYSQSGVYYKVAKDIDLKGDASNQWTPIGYSSVKTFKGNFDGGGHTISGLYIDATTSYQAFFGYIKDGAVVKNLIVDGTVKNTMESDGFSSNIAGIAVYNNGSTIINCINKATVNGSNSYAGGICSFNQGQGSVVNCANFGSISIKSYVGGIAGFNNAGTIHNCFNAGKLTKTTSYLGSITGFQDYNTSNVISDCYFDKSFSTAAYGMKVAGTVTATSMTTAEMQEQGFVDKLNDNVKTYNNGSPDEKAYGWKVVEGGYPTIDFTYIPE